MILFSAARGIRACFLVLIFCLLFTAAVFASEEVSFKHILDNGLTVLIREMPSSPVVSVYALVKTGSATEGEYLGSGISHFLEHMLFKGTEKRAAGEIASRIQAVGGSINASTGMDYTIYTLTVPEESFDTALDVLADILMNSVLDSQEMEREREVIFGEMRMHNDNPDRRLSELAYRNIYLRHPYRHPVIGYKELLAGVTGDDLWNYYETHYAPNNMILSIAGNVHVGTVFPKVRETFKDFQRRRDILRNLPSEPAQISPRRYEEEYPTDLTRLSMAFPTVSLLDPDLYALDVLAMILGQGESSRLYLNVYKKQGLVHGISASSFTPADQGFFEIEALLEYENVEKTIQAVLEEIKLIREKGVSRAEVEKAKRQVLSDHIFQQQKSSHAAYAQAVDEAVGGDYQFSSKYVQAVRALTGEDIRRIAGKYLGDAALTVTVLKPKGVSTEARDEETSLPSPEIQKHVFPNGLTVLLREDHAFPLVSMRAVLQGGLRQEPAQLNGLSQMVSLMWDQGTKSLTAREIAQRSESAGMALGALSGKNSLSLSLECLKEDFDQALGLFEDLVKNSDFPEEEIGKVKENMKAAVRGRADQISHVTSQAVKELLFTEHPLRRDEGGTLETIDRIQRRDLVDFYGRLAVPSNMVISIFGDIHSADVLAVLEKKFGTLNPGDAALISQGEGPPDAPREQTLFLDKEQAMVMLGFQGVSLSDEDRYGLEVLASVLGSSFNGRLFNSIREKFGQAYALGGDFVPALDAGFIYFYVLTSDDKTAEVTDCLRREIRRLQTEPVPPQELEDVKMYLKGTFKTQLETNAALSLMSGLDELYGIGYASYQQYDEKIGRVGASEIQRLARKYLDWNRSVLVTTRPRND